MVPPPPKKVKAFLQKFSEIFRREFRPNQAQAAPKPFTVNRTNCVDRVWCHELQEFSQIPESPASFFPEPMRWKTLTNYQRPHLKTWRR